MRATLAFNGLNKLRFLFVNKMLFVEVLFFFITNKLKKQINKQDSGKILPAKLTWFHGNKILPNLCKLYKVFRKTKQQQSF